MSVPPVANGFMTDVDAALVQNVFDLPQAEGKSNVIHHCELDDVRARLIVFKVIDFGHDEQNIRTGQEKVHFSLTRPVEELRLALLEFKARYNAQWLLQRHDWQTPAAVRALHSEPLAMAA